MLFILIIFSSVTRFLFTEKKGFRTTRTIGDARTSNCPLRAVKEMDKMKREMYDNRFETENEIIAVR